MKTNKKIKELLSNINKPVDSKIILKDINSFFQNFCDVEEIIRGCPAIIHDSYENTNLNMKSSDFYSIKTKNANACITLGNKSILFKYPDKVYTDTIEFLELWKFLEENKYIKSVEKDPVEIKNFLVPLLNETVKFGIHDIYPIFNKLWLIVKDHVLLEIFPLQKLNEFINKGFKDSTESKKRKNPPEKIKRLLQKEINSVCPIPNCNNKDVAHFQIHHIDEDKSNNDELNLLMICPTCHSKITKGDITQEEIINIKANLFLKKEDIKRRKDKNVLNINSKISKSVVGNVINVSNMNVKGKTKPKMNYAEGTIGADLNKKNYIKHLIDRYNEFIKDDEYKGKRRFALIWNVIRKEYGGDCYHLSITKFDNLSLFLQTRIKNTKLGRNLNSRGRKIFSTYEEYLKKYN